MGHFLKMNDSHELKHQTDLEWTVTDQSNNLIRYQMFDHLRLLLIMILYQAADASNHHIINTQYFIHTVQENWTNSLNSNLHYATFEMFIIN